MARRWSCSPLSNEQGFALVAVLLVATLVAGLTVGLLILAQRTARDGANLVAEITDRAAMEAGLNRIILAYAGAGDPLREQLVPDARPVAWQFSGRTLTLRVQAESGKLDVNAGNRNHIAALIARLLPEQQAQMRFLSRLDESRSQEALITSVPALLSPFDRMTSRRDLVEAHFTVLTGQRGFDPRTAPQAVIETAPALAQEVKREILQARSDRRAWDPVQVYFDGAQMFVAEKPVYTLRCELSDNDGRRAAMAAQVEFPDHGRIRVFSWATATPRLYD